MSLATSQKPATSPANSPTLDMKLAELIQTYWTNFAKTGNPNAAGIPIGPSNDDNGIYIQFQQDGRVETAAGLRAAQCDIYRQWLTAPSRTRHATRLRDFISKSKGPADLAGPLLPYRGSLRVMRNGSRPRRNPAQLRSPRLSIRRRAHQRRPAFQDHAHRHVDQQLAQAALVRETPS